MSNLVKNSTKLNKIVKAAVNCPVYQWRFKDKFPTTYEEFPITTKQHLYEGIENHIFNPNSPCKYRQSIYITPSGGSTTKSGDLSKMFVNVMDYKENELQRDLFASFVSKYNIINSSHIFGNLFGATKLYKGEDVNRSLIEKCGATNISLERTCCDELTYLYLKRFSANGIAANPARILRFIQYLNENNLNDLCLENLFYGGENMSFVKLEIIKNTINCNNIIGLYGSAEAGVWSIQNEKIFGNKYYYYDPKIIYVEIEENTKEIILTSLLKHRYPLIKYNTNDCGNIIDINKHYGILEIFGRNELSFSIGGNYYLSNNKRLATVPIGSN
eukprot:148179_1